MSVLSLPLPQLLHLITYCFHSQPLKSHSFEVIYKLLFCLKSFKGSQLPKDSSPNSLSVHMVWFLLIYLEKKSHSCWYSCSVYSCQIICSSLDTRLHTSEFAMPFMFCLAYPLLSIWTTPVIFFWELFWLPKLITQCENFLPTKIF